ncbi:MAG: hypothetical protein OEY89_15070 [Gammaproteobacteria bacterium]|nr:hypothetical protein [Gammaproteobacteria bacterium]
MGERIYMFLFGTAILIALYFDEPSLIYAVIGINLFEGITNIRIGNVLRKIPGFGGNNEECRVTDNTRFTFSASRVWRLVVGSVLALCYFVFYEQAWFFVWFVGFAVAGAGLSGVCPVLILIQRLGFK